MEKEKMNPWQKGLLIVGIILLVLGFVLSGVNPPETEEPVVEHPQERADFCVAQVYSLFNITSNSTTEDGLVFLAEISANGTQPTEEEFKSVSPDARNAFVTWMSCVMKEGNQTNGKKG